MVQHTHFLRYLYNLNVKYIKKFYNSITLNVTYNGSGSKRGL
jgi:hypothetical protein